MAADKIFPDDYVPHVQGSSYHPKWEKANPGENQKWVAFRDAVKAYEAGDAVTVPSMATSYGKALVDAGRLHMSVIDIGASYDEDPPPPPPPPPANTWDGKLATEFPLAAFTPTRTVTVTTPTQLNNACSNLQPGDRVNASGFTYTGSFQGLRDKFMSDWCEFHFTNVNFVGTGTVDVFLYWNTQKIRCFGADVSGGGYGVRMFDSIDVEFRGTVHDVGATGLHVVPTDSSRPSYRSPTRNIGVIEAWNCGLDPSLDPHPEKFTGLHAAYVGKSGSLPNINCKYAVDTHDQNCAGGLQMTNNQGAVVMVRADNLYFRATSQTAGNGLQFFGTSCPNLRVPYIEVNNITGNAVENHLNVSLPGGVVEYGRATNFALNGSHEGNYAWGTNGGITYQDVQPQSFGTS